MILTHLAHLLYHVLCSTQTLTFTEGLQFSVLSFPIIFSFKVPGGEADFFIFLTESHE